MSYSSYLTPRPETISSEIEGIIDIANLKDETKTKLEARPKNFLDLTYPTTDISKVIEHITLRFASSKTSSGLFLFEGLKGSGKSHLLLLICHLFQHPEIAQAWLSKNSLTWNAPKDAVIIINKFTDDPHDSIWNMIFQSLGSPIPMGKTHPKLSDFQKALGDRKVILIFDELEQGIKVISDPAIQAQNIAFLQMLSEFSNRSRQVTLFASIYSDRVEPGSTLKRVPRCVVQFDNTKDQNNIILHRLFNNYRDFDKSRIIPVIESHIQIWGKHASIEKDEIKTRFNDTYPFSPSLLDIILKKIPARGGFQNVRGALAFLGNLVRLTHSSHDIITPAGVSLEDKATTIMLKDLDPSGDLINKASENMEDLLSKASLAKKIAPAVLLYTLTGTSGSIGASRDQLIQDIISPSIDINTFEQSLMAFQKYASYFWHQEGRYYFDLEENPEAKVEFKSISYSDGLAREKLYDLLKIEIFKETDNVTVFESVETVKEILKQFDKTRPRYVFTGRRLTKEERHSIYFGADYRNLILLLEPKDDQFQLGNDKDLLKWAKRVIAAKTLAGNTKKSSRLAEYERIARTDQSCIIDRIKKAGLVFVGWEIYGSSVLEDRIELELLPSDFLKDKVLEKLNNDYFPMLTFREHLEGRIDEIKNRLVKEVDAEYRATLGFPVPTNIRAVSNAIRDLCKDAIIGIQHSTGNYCKINPPLNETEIFNAKISPPFETLQPQPKPPSAECPKCGLRSCKCIPESCPGCGQTPCECSDTSCPLCQQDPCICPKLKTKELQLKIPPQNSIGSLRQETAFRLQEYEQSISTNVSYQIFYQKKDIGDLSTLPTGLRGSLSGQGDLTAEIYITKAGRFTKSQIEQQIEALPALAGAEYSAELAVEVKI
ncbi:hypothetical protein [Desulfobacterium sp. N47]|uniref:hypothetical protein n=1 Tax=Desulfobacterium sp. N47 TaxID=3115210 RepID=UPI003CB8A4E4